MIPDLGKWVDEAKTSVHYEGQSRAGWEHRFLTLFAEYEQQAKIIKKLVE